MDFREKTVRVDGEELRLQLWDTAGQERFRRSMVPHYYRNVAAVVFVYDVSRKSSLDGMSHWIRECREHGLFGSGDEGSGAVPMLMVGNKVDEDKDSSEVAVSTNAAQR